MATHTCRKKYFVKNRVGDMVSKTTCQRIRPRLDSW
jgi:hypothetical protein